MVLGNHLRQLLHFSPNGTPYTTDNLQMTNMSWCTFYLVEVPGILGKIERDFLKKIFPVVNKFSLKKVGWKRKLGKIRCN